MSKDTNTFWTKFEDNFYRLKDGKLFQASSNKDNLVDTSTKIATVSISPNILDQINQEFGTQLNSRDFN